jgi:catechol 2,3-dioxygenase-like lactoylglutathione lyase family enzyme
MMKFDHLNLPVRDLDRSRTWWVESLGLTVEFEVPNARAVALNDGEGFAIFLQEKLDVVPSGIALWFQVDDVGATHVAWSARGVRFTHGPQKNFWGYGAETADPDGYLIRLWDARSMKEK